MHETDWRTRARKLAGALAVAAAVAGAGACGGEGTGPATGGSASVGATTAGAAAVATGAGGATVTAGAAVTGTAAAVVGAPAGAPADLAATRAAINRGVAFLLAARGPDGLIGGHAGVSGLAALAIALSPDRPGKDDPRLAPTLAALAALARPDGAIAGKDFPGYTTAIALLVLAATGAHPELVAPAQRWLADHQLDEGEGSSPSDPGYGGIGYGDDGKTDLSNLHFALEALHETHFKDRPEVYARALTFLSRCQNWSETNDQPWAGNDGGFVYRPGESKAGGTASSGSMTYAGLKSLVYASVARDDPRVKAALVWISAHYSVDENPGLGKKGLYYYYQAFARALALLGEPVLTDAAGVRHDWYGELTRKLLAMQAADGSWKNDDPTYWESNPVLATSRALLALEYGWATAGGGGGGGGTK